MKAVILAAGRGKRMQHLTLDLPKPVIEVAEKPFLWFLIENLHNIGIKEIGVVVGYKKEKIEEFIKDNGFENIVLIEQEKPKGTGDAIKIAHDFVKDDDFIVVNGDNLYSVEDLKSLAGKIGDGFSYVAGLKHENPENYGVLVFDEHHHLKKIHEKPKKFVGNVINAGLYKFTKDVFDALDKIKLSERGEYEITDAISLLAEQGKIKVIHIKEKWMDLTSPEDVPKVESYIKENYDF